MWFEHSWPPKPSGKPAPSRLRWNSPLVLNEVPWTIYKWHSLMCSEPGCPLLPNEGREVPDSCSRPPNALSPRSEASARDLSRRDHGRNFAGKLGSAGQARDVAAAALAVPQPLGPPNVSDLLLRGLALLVAEGPESGLPWQGKP